MQVMCSEIQVFYRKVIALFATSNYTESLHLRFKNKVHKGTFNGKRYQNTLLQMLPRDTILHLEYVNKGDL